MGGAGADRVGGNAHPDDGRAKHLNSIGFTSGAGKPSRVNRKRENTDRFDDLSDLGANSAPDRVERGAVDLADGFGGNIAEPALGCRKGDGIVGAVDEDGGVASNAFVIHSLLVVGDHARRIRNLVAGRDIG